MKIYLKSSIYFIITILIGSIIVTLINYFSILPYSIIKVIRLIIPLVGVFIGSYKIGKTSSKKGYIEGIKFGSIWVIIFIIINLIIKSFELSSIIYFIIFLLISVLGGVIGINKK